MYVCMYVYISHNLASVSSHRKTVCRRHPPRRALRIQISDCLASFGKTDALAAAGQKRKGAVSRVNT